MSDYPSHRESNRHLGPGELGVELTIVNCRLEDLRLDGSLPAEKRRLYREFYTHGRDELQLRLTLLAHHERIAFCERALQLQSDSLHFANSEAGHREARRKWNQRMAGLAISGGTSTHSLSQIRDDPEVEEISKAKKSFAAAESLLSDARSALQASLFDLQALHLEDAKWKEHEAAAKHWESSRSWESITPEKLRSSVQALREAFDADTWKCEQSTKELCFLALHPPPEHASSSPQKNSSAYRKLLSAYVGKDIEKHLMGPRNPPPVVFKSYLDLHLAALKAVCRATFQQFLDIGVKQIEAINAHPVEWAKRQVQILISFQESDIRLLIRRVCDIPVVSESGGTEVNDEESLYWGSWRAPGFIQMQPSGNTPYLPQNAWSREAVDRSEQVLQGLAKRLATSLRIDLDKVARSAHVRYAQGKEPIRERSKEPTENKNASPPIPDNPSRQESETSKAISRKQGPRSYCVPEAIEVLRKNPEISVIEFCLLLDRKAEQHPDSLKYLPPKSWRVRSFLEQYRKRPNTVSKFITVARKAANSLE